MGGSGVCGAGGGVGRMVRERVRWSTGWSGVDWFPIVILGGMAGGTASVSTLGGRAGGVCTGDGGGTGGVGRGGSILGAAGGFSLGVGWVWCGGGVWIMSRMQVRASKCSVCIVAGTSLMAHDTKLRARTMRSSGVTDGCIR